MLLGTAVTVYVGWLTRLGGPTTFDPDEHASALYINRLVHGRQLEQIVFSTPKLLLTLVHRLGWMLFHDWPVGAVLTVPALVSRLPPGLVEDADTMYSLREGTKLLRTPNGDVRLDRTWFPLPAGGAMSDHSDVAAHDAASAEAAPPDGDTPRFVRATVDAVDEQRYLLTVKLKDGSNKSGVSYNPLAYIPRQGEQVWLTVLGQDPTNWWVIGVASRGMFGTTDVGRTPSAALRCQSDFPVDNETEIRVKMTGADWDTDKMIPDTISATRPITTITPRRTGLYTIKAGGHWHASTAGRRVMDLRWAGTPGSDPHDDVIIARDEKGPDKSGDCAHSLSVDVMITDASASSSPRVRTLAAKPSVELVVFQTSGDKLALRHNLLFLQMTYQGPKP